MPDLDVHLEAIATGDADAFARWLSGAEGPLRRGLLRLGAHIDIECTLQETLLRVWQIAPRVQRDGRENSLLRVAARIARNLALGELRRNRLEFVDQDELERLGDDLVIADAGAADSAGDPLLHDLIERCRGELPARQAQALNARLEAAGAQADANLAARVGMSLNTFLQNFTRARRFLAQCLERNGVKLSEVLV